jgi:hypothetical protein
MIRFHGRLCDLVVTVPEFGSRDPEFDYRCYELFLIVVGLERSPLNLVTIHEELLQRKRRGSGLETNSVARSPRTNYTD